MTNRERIEMLARDDPLAHQVLRLVRLGACSYVEGLEMLALAYAKVNDDLLELATRCAREHGPPNAFRIADGPPLRREDVEWVPRGEVTGD